MNSPRRGNALRSRRAKAGLLVALALLGPASRLRADEPDADAPHRGHLGKKHARSGGYQGFGLSYHLGYGYGGSALGVGPDGGYPFYGGPGYPHEAPPLNRLGRIIPFAYQGDPGPPCNGIFRGFQPVGPLAVDTPIVKSAIDPREGPMEGDFGGFTGAIPYPDSVFAPFTTAAATTGSITGEKAPEPAPAMPNPTPPLPSTSDPQSSIEPPKSPESSTAIGIEPDGDRGLRVSRTDPEGLATRAGLHEGDVIRSINGYRTTERRHLDWVVANAAPDRLLKMDVRSVADGRDRTVTVRTR